MKKRAETPIINALETYSTNGKIKMHMPGHKGGKGFAKWFVENLVQYDITEIPGLDNLHNPESVIKASMERCANVFGARKSFYLVNGSTSGIHAMLISAFNRGDRLLVQRDCHQSVINALILSGIQPVFVTPGYNERWHLKMPAGLHDWEKAVLSNPDIKGAVVTYPDYYGMCAPISEIADLMHQNGKLLLVDEAHGAHFAISRRLPQTALKQGADLCVQSFHKTLPALTQAAVLHIGSDRISEDRVKRAVSMLTTTSPSYPVMASIEYAADFAKTDGSGEYDRLICLLDDIKKELNKMVRLKILPDEIQGIKRDPTRIVIDTSDSCLTGYDLYEKLSREYGIVAEMADESHVVFIVTTADSEKELTHLKNSLMDLDRKSDPADSQKKHLSFRPMEQGKCIIPELSVYLNGCRYIPLNDSEGKRSAGMVTPYPPGIPMLCPGETITREHIHLLRDISTSRVDVHGISISGNGREIKIRVFDE
ncbi:MAG: aminotransferase class I/II-fold pyridoxal phosphate-dependent enzyme [Clostridiaceae bacterium]|nr:aminotransferase class I/II-fold pyridoxal phosphate-dependent enzyme [Clostridiaceae bacterium]